MWFISSKVYRFWQVFVLPVVLLHLVLVPILATANTVDCDPEDFLQIRTDDHGWGSGERLRHILNIDEPGTTHRDWVRRAVEILTIDNSLTAKGKAQLWIDFATAINKRQSDFNMNYTVLANGDHLFLGKFGELILIRSDGVVYRGKQGQYEHARGLFRVDPENTGTLDRAILEPVREKMQAELARAGAKTIGQKWAFVIRELQGSLFLNSENATRNFERWLSVIRDKAGELPMRSFTDSSGAKIYYSKDNRVIIFHPNGEIETAKITKSLEEERLLETYGENWRSRVGEVQSLSRMSGEERQDLIQLYQSVIGRKDSDGYVNPGRNAISYIAEEMAGRSMEAKAEAWRNLASLIRQSDPTYRFLEYAGSDGSIVFRGLAGYALILTKEGEVYKGSFPDEVLSASDSVWRADYSRLKRIYPSPVAKGIQRNQEIPVKGIEAARAGDLVLSDLGMAAYRQGQMNVEGVHVYLLVRRNSDGKEGLVLANRLGDEPGTINTHRSLAAEAEANYGEDGFTVLAAGEVILSPDGILGISNRSGTFPSEEVERLDYALRFFVDRLRIPELPGMRRAAVDSGARRRGSLVHDGAEQQARTLASLSPQQRAAYERTLRVVTRLGSLLRRYGITETEYRDSVEAYMKSHVPDRIADTAAYRNYLDIVRARGESPMSLSENEYWLVNPQDDRHLLTLVQRSVRSEGQAGALRYTDVWARLFSGDPDQQLLVLRRLPRLVESLLANHGTGPSLSTRDIRRILFPSEDGAMRISE